MSGLSNYIKEGTLDHIFCADLVDTALERPGTLYLACHSSAPTDDGTPLTEYLGGSYIRQIIRFNQADTDDDGTYVSNRELITFVGMPNSTITLFAIWDAVSAGNMISSGGIIAVNGSGATSIATGGGDTLSISASTLRMYL